MSLAGFAVFCLTVCGIGYGAALLLLVGCFGRKGLRMFWDCVTGEEANRRGKDAVGS